MILCAKVLLPHFAVLWRVISGGHKFCAPTWQWPESGPKRTLLQIILQSTNIRVWPRKSQKQTDPHLTTVFQLSNSVIVFLILSSLCIFHLLDLCIAHCFSALHPILEKEKVIGTNTYASMFLVENMLCFAIISSCLGYFSILASLPQNGKRLCSSTTWHAKWAVWGRCVAQIRILFTQPAKPSRVTMLL